MKKYGEAPDGWTGIVETLYRDSIAVVVGVFRTDGALQYANAGMQVLLNASQGKNNPAGALINPDFGTLTGYPESPGPVFEGTLTVGDGKSNSRSILAKAWRKGPQLLIWGEYDVLELDFMNQRMAELNTEISNIQRALIKEKTMLGQTLDELRETQAMLIHSEKMNALGKLVAGIVHEINNPVAFLRSNLHSMNDAFSDVSGAFESLEDLVQSNGNRDMIDKAAHIREAHDLDFIFDDFGDMHRAVSDGVLRIQNIVGDLRKFSRLDESDIKEIDLAESIRSTLSVVSPEFNKRGITVDLKIDGLPPVQCHPAELSQVFMNLVINAAQAMDKGGILGISGTEEHGNIKLEFSDTGTGIPPEIIDKIFNPFFTTKPPGEGTGLGLSLAYKIVTEKHRGSISVDSSPNQGTKFTIIIPKAS